MKSRGNFPLDFAKIFSLPMVAIFSGLFSWVLWGTREQRLWTIGIALIIAVVSGVLLFMAKLPEYREGHYFRIGCRRLPSREQRFYRMGMWLLVPPTCICAFFLLAIWLRS